MNKVALIQLAAGNSIRFGGDKLTAEYKGRRIIEYSCDVFSAFDFSFKVLVARENDMQLLNCVAAEYDEIVFNPHPEEGIASSISYGIEAVKASEVFIRSKVTGILFSVSDQPNLSVNTVQRILAEFQSHQNRIIAPCTKDGKRGNPVLFPVELLPEFDELRGDTGGNAIIKKHPDLLLPVETDETELFDIDNREDIGHI